MWILFLCKKTARRSDGAKGPDLIGRESQRECIGQSHYPYAFAENVAGMATYGEGRDDTILRQKHLWQRREKGMKKRRLLSVVLLMIAVLVMSLNAQAAVKINKKKAVLIKGQSVALKITGTKDKVKWSTNKKKVATVTQKGVVKAKAKGSATISAKVGKKNYKCKIKVETPKINKNSAVLNVGQKLTLKMAGNTQKVKWSSADTDIASVTQKGVVTAKSSGKVKITAAIAKKKYSCKITVKNPITSVTLDKTVLLLDKGSQTVLQASYLPFDTTDPTTVTWSSSNSKVATVSNGIVGGLSAGEAVITAKIGTKSASCMVQVNETYGSVTGNITYYYNSYKGNVADSGSYVFLFPEDGSAKNKYTTLSIYDASSDLTNYNIYSAKVDGSGYYTINNIPTGRYRAVLISYKTSGEEWFDAYNDDLSDAPQSFYEEIASYFSNCAGHETAMSLAQSISFRKWTVKDVSIATNMTQTLSYDFGITYI